MTPVRRLPVFVTVALALTMMSIDSTIVATALHTLEQELDAPLNWAGWTISAYALGFVLMLPVSGQLSERYGARRVFIGSVLVFCTASLLCGLANNIYLLIALRALQAAGGAGFTPTATQIIVNHFGSERDRAVGLFGSIFPLGAMVGPIFGGLFVTYWSWRGIFFVNLPLGLLVALLAWRLVPPDAPTAETAPARMDFYGMALLGVCLLATMGGVTYLGEKHAVGHASVVFASALCAVLAGGLFYRHINRSPHPFLAPRLVYGPGFGAVNLLNAMYAGLPAGIVALVPLYAANQYGFDAMQAGTLLMAQGVAAIVLSGVGTLFLRRTGYHRPLYLGGVVAALGAALLGVPPPAGIAPYTWLACGAAGVGAGIGILNPASRNAGLQLAPEHSSTLAALRSMCNNLGAMTTVAVVTAVLNRVHHPGQAHAVLYLGAAALLVLTLPVVARVPEHRGAW